MMKWVVTRAPSGTVSRNVSSCPHNQCNCNKENFTLETTPLRNNNSYTCYNFEKVSDLENNNVSFEPKYQHTASTKRKSQAEHSTPLTSRSHISGRAKKLRTRRERNRALINRLSVTTLTNLSETATPASPRPQRLEPLWCENASDAQLLQHTLPSNRLFSEREVKTPEEPSPLENGKLCRQRAVRRKHGTTVQTIHHRSQQVDPSDSTNFFNCYVFRELAREMLI